MTAVSNAIVDEKIIDEINILEATKLAMLRAYLDLQKKYKISPQIILVDGNFIPFKKQGKISEILAIVKGDQKSFSIAAASIIAKETRDQIMCDLDQKYPHQFHREKIREHGICEFHRKSFEPIKSILHANS